jgi:flavin reductase
MHPSEGLSANDPYQGLAIGKDAFLEAMSHTASGVYLVTTDGRGGRYAATISAVASVSADPTMLLACINKRNPMCAAIESNRQFCVNALNADQVRISQTFSGKPDSGGLAYDFESAEWLDGLTEAKRLKGAVASFDCLLHHNVVLGTHSVFIGLVVGAAFADGRPLLYAKRSYHSPCALNPS